MNETMMKIKEKMEELYALVKDVAPDVEYIAPIYRKTDEYISWSMYATQSDSSIAMNTDMMLLSDGRLLVPSEMAK